MPRILTDGTPIIRTQPEILQRLIDQLRSRFGVGVTNPANSIRKFGEAVGSLPFDALEQDFADWISELDPRSCSLNSLKNHLKPLFEQLPATVASGTVHLSYNLIPTTPTPYFATGDLEFVSGAGDVFPLAVNLNPPGVIFSSGESGADSETIGGGNTKIAQRITLDDKDFPQAVKISVGTTITGTPLARVRLETDSSGSPSGILLDSRLDVSGVALTASTVIDAIFPLGFVSGEAAYWVVIEVTGGTATFSGGSSGAPNQAKIYNGAAWILSSQVEGIGIDVYEGGKAFVAAQVSGAQGNISANAIGNVRFTNPTAQTRFNSTVVDYENLLAFTGGRDAETAQELRTRTRRAKSARGTSSLSGIIAGITDGTVVGVTSADGVENDGDAWTSDDVILNNSGKTGASSETIGATNTRIAQRFTVTEYASAVSFAFDLGTDTSSVFDVRLETNVAGSPSGVLTNASATITGVTPAGTSRVVFSFNDGSFLTPGVYWLVFQRTSGSAVFEGSSAGATDNVKYYDGAWNLSSTVEDIRVEVFGGLPPHSFRLFPEGGENTVVAQAIYDLKAPGIYSDGPDSGTRLDHAGRSGTIRFKRPTDVPVVFAVEVQTTSDFSGSEQDLRDLLFEYVDSLGVSEDLIYEEAKARLIHGDDRTTGVYDITLFRVGRKSSFPTPGDLTAGEVINLQAAFGEVFSAVADAANISIVLTPV